ncbi:Pyridinium-3,5-biscarboxylic acid mononucleotide synthase [Candidatus Desulfarcum epimagneticum]|uniref:Pyridinium-3,5-biscarboxylic acid mononucleotide synthase n=1 Tax=uncultured Desulfobacteraceae bacterium TaxID=218296 RepID=A0A484HJI4_9BACT|nr:Pyridinium-3,5-biscarboxylic acid mononucleotide synthase [uncultured Desulfobacteraceae bacterium]
MNIDLLKKELENFASGKASLDETSRKLISMSYEDINYAHIDHHRSIRKGFPEVIFGEGKTSAQIIGIMEKITAQENVCLATRVAPGKAEKIKTRFPGASYDEDSRMIVWKKQGMEEKAAGGRGDVLVISAGTSDIPVAKEALITARAMGNRTESVFDVGVSGIHRLFAHREKIAAASVLVVAAGMEGALPSVVAGMTSRPVIAVPTSVGYGAGFGGLAALLGMLNSCASNVAVVNIDNGFGAGYMAAIINRD